MHNEIKKQGWYLLRAFFCVAMLSIGSRTNAQAWEFGAGVGLTNYQGDLTSFNFDDGVQVNFDPAVNLFAKKYVNPLLNFNLNLMLTGVRGSDANSSAEGVRQRNLSFQSSVQQISARVEVNVLGFEPGDLNKRISPFATAGFSVFRFNPLAEFQGNKIPLQPLGTEGQGLDILPGFDRYKRVSFNVPMGGGLKWNLTDRLTLTMEMIFFYTFTDFLDDVSTNYVSYPVLLEQRGPLTAALANRTGEFLGTDPVITSTGARRGNPDVDDHWLTGLVSIGYRFDPLKRSRVSGKKVRCPKL